MAYFAIYRKSKRAKDLVLVQHAALANPLEADNEADALQRARDVLGENVERLRAHECAAGYVPAPRINHRFYTHVNARGVRKMGGL